MGLIDRPLNYRSGRRQRRVIDVGAGGDPDPRATETADLYHDGCDHQFDVREQWPIDDSSVDGLIARHVLEHIPHRDLPVVFDEAARVLRPGGWFEIRVPVGTDADADPTHTADWGWRTIDRYLDDATHWITTPPFDLEEKRLRAWMCNAMWPLSPLIRAGARLHPCEFWYEFPGATGEIVMTLRSAEP